MRSDTARVSRIALRYSTSQSRGAPAPQGDGGRQSRCEAISIRQHYMDRCGARRTMRDQVYRDYRGTRSTGTIGGPGLLEVSCSVRTTRINEQTASGDTAVFCPSDRTWWGTDPNLDPPWGLTTWYRHRARARGHSPFRDRHRNMED
ncbi:unnamed protein product [Merluccius merluccius]